MAIFSNKGSNAPLFVDSFAKLYKIRLFSLSTEANSTKHTEVNSTKPTSQLVQAFSPKKRGKSSKPANCQYPAFKAVLDIKGNPDQMPIRQIRVYWGNGESTIVPGANNVGNGTRISMTYTYGTTGSFPIRIDAIDQWCWTTNRFNPDGRKDCHLVDIPKVNEEDISALPAGVLIGSSRELIVNPERGE